MRMKHLQMKRAVLPVLFALLLSLVEVTNALAQTFTVGNLNYSLNDDGVSVTVTGHVDGTSATGELVIPESVEYYNTSYTVTVIGENAFNGCSGLTGLLALPETLASIEASAFNGCSGLTGNLTIPNSVTYLGTNAFSNCNGFTGELTIGTSLAKTGRTVFSYCNFTTLNYNAVSCYLMDVHVYIGALISIYEGSWNGSFWYNQYSSYYHWLYGCNSFVNLNIGDGVTKLPYCFLDGCSSFTGNLVVPESVTTIEWNAFNGCSGFTGSLTVPQSVTTLDNNAFANCNGFTALNFNAANCTSMSSSWLENVTSLTSLSIGENVQRIPDDFVNGKSTITGPLTIPNSVTYIGANAFSGCNGFSGVLSLGNSVLQIGNSAFFNACVGFTSFKLWAETPPTLGNNVFVSADYSIPVQVPCGTLDAYQNAEGWNVFTNFQEPNPCLWEITATAIPTTGGTVSGAGVYEQGQTCTLTATPYEGISFVNWTEDGVEVSTDAQYAFTVTGNRNLVAHFVIPTYTVGVTINPSNGGTVTFDEEVGSSLFDFEEGTISNTWNNAVSSYPWVIWNSNSHGGSYCLASSNLNNHNTESFIEVTMEFIENGSVEFYSRISSERNYDIGHFYIDDNLQFDESGYSDWTRRSFDVAVGSHTFRWSYTKDGSFSENEDRYFIDDITFIGTNSKTFLFNETCTLNATPSSSDFVFLNWTEDGEVVSSNAQYSFTVTENRNLVANFFQIRVAITALASPEACGTVTGGGNYMIGQNCTLTATPNEGYAFYQWLENGEVVSTNATYSFIITSDRTLTARFRTTNPIIFADPNVEALCVNKWDTDGDGFLSYSEAAAVTDIGYTFYNNGSITSFDELQYFTGVTSIPAEAFRNCNNLYSIVFPESLTSIGSYAFLYCSSLTGDLIIPNSVTVINYGAFLYCYGLNGTLTIGENLNYMEWGVFSGTNFSAVNYNAINCETIEGWFDESAAYIVSLNIGENVETIPYSTFSGFNNITGDLVIPNSVTSIGDYAFQGCSQITSVSLPASLTAINNGVFSNCHGLSSVTIPEGVSSIGDWAFYNCNSLTSLQIPNAVSSVGNCAFEGCTNLSGTLAFPSSLSSIGSEAFMNCVNLDGIILPENLVTIGNSAFKNCGGLRGEITLPESLELVEGHAFYGCDGISTVNYNAVNCQTMGSAESPVFYDCAFTQLNIGENVQSIPNFAFKRCFSIADMTVAAVNPPTIYPNTFGMVSRSIPVHVPYGTGDAYRTAQYWEEFFNVIEGNGVVYTNHWLPNTHQYAYNMSVIGVIQIDGVEQAIEGLEIGAFYGDECRGSQLINYYPQVDRFMVFLTLYGEEDDMLTFRLYDHILGQESELGCSSTISFVPNEIIGTTANPYVFNFTYVQNAMFEEGWNWYSTYVEQNGINGLELLKNGLGEKGILIKSQLNGFTTYEDGEWMGNLQSIDNENMYLVNVASYSVVSMPGSFTAPAQHPITLQPGWTWIGYPSASPCDINTALGNNNVQDGDVIKSQTGFSIYMDGMGWFGTLNTLVPGQGFMYNSHSNQAVNLVYATNAKGGVLRKNLVADDNHWVPDMKAYPNNMSIMAIVELGGQELGEDGWELAAFVGNECRGSVRLLYVETLNRHMAFLTVTGNEAAELTWRLYDPVSGMEYYNIDDKFSFEANAVVGSLDTPLTVSFSATTGMDDLAGRLSVYPNPANANELFSITLPTESEARIEIVDLMGAVMSAKMVQGSTMVKAPEMPGMYMVKVVFGSKGTYTYKLVVE